MVLFFGGVGRTFSKTISGSKPNSMTLELMVYSVANPPTCLIKIMGKKDSTGITDRESRSPFQIESYI